MAAAAGVGGCDGRRAPDKRIAARRIMHPWRAREAKAKHRSMRMPVRRCHQKEARRRRAARFNYNGAARAPSIMASASRARRIDARYRAPSRGGSIAAGRARASHRGGRPIALAQHAAICRRQLAACRVVKWHQIYRAAQRHW